MYSESVDFDEKMEALRVMLDRLNDVLQIGSGVNPLFQINALEIGGSGGLLSGLISKDAKMVICTDIVNHQNLYGGQYPKLLKEKFERNGHDLDLGHIEFQVADAQKLPYRDELFDLAFSLNAFEHIPDPLAALLEAVRVVRKGGQIYLTFDPVWTADTGSHFSEFVTEPWQHIISKDDDFCTRMREAGATNDQVTEYLHAMNRVPCWIYREEFPKLLDRLGVTKYKVYEWKGCVSESFVNHKNRMVAADYLGCEPNELMTRGFSFCIIK